MTMVCFVLIAIYNFVNKLTIEDLEEKQMIQKNESKHHIASIFFGDCCTWNNREKQDVEDFTFNFFKSMHSEIKEKENKVKKTIR